MPTVAEMLMNSFLIKINQFIVYVEVNSVLYGFKKIYHKIQDICLIFRLNLFPVIKTTILKKQTYDLLKFVFHAISSKQFDIFTRVASICSYLSQINSLLFNSLPCLGCESASSLRWCCCVRIHRNGNVGN